MFVFSLSMEHSKETSVWHTINFIIAFIALFVVFILIFVIIDERNKLRIIGIPWTVQLGIITSPPLEPLSPTSLADLTPSSSSTTSSGVINNEDTDTMITGGKNMYVNHSNMDINLVVSDNVNNVVGTHIAVNNQGTGIITLIGGENIALSPSSIVMEPKEHLEMIMISPGTFTLLFQK